MTPRQVVDAINSFIRSTVRKTSLKTTFIPCHPPPSADVSLGRDMTPRQVVNALDSLTDRLQFEIVFRTTGLHRLLDRFTAMNTLSKAFSHMSPPPPLCRRELGHRHDPPPGRRRARPVHSGAGRREASGRGGAAQPVAPAQDPEPDEGGDRPEEYSHDWPDRVRQNRDRAAAGEAGGRAVCQGGLLLTIAWFPVFNSWGLWIAAGGEF